MDGGVGSPNPGFNCWSALVGAVWLLCKEGVSGSIPLSSMKKIKPRGVFVAGFLFVAHTVGTPSAI
jgi:hypothetical protein